MKRVSLFMGILFAPCTSLLPFSVVHAVYRTDGAFLWLKFWCPNFERLLILPAFGYPRLPPPAHGGGRRQHAATFKKQLLRMI